MFMWKRKVGDSLVIGDDAVVKVAGVSQANGERFKGTVTLGFSVPEGRLVQRAEKYVLQNEKPPFPQFYRYCQRGYRKVSGYSWEPPAEVSTKNERFTYEMIAGYDDMDPRRDREVHIYLFRSDAEAEACIIGLNATGEVGVQIGVLKTFQQGMWMVLIDFYHSLDYLDQPNPVIRSFADPNPRVMAAIEEQPRRMAG